MKKSTIDKKITRAQKHYWRLTKKLEEIASNIKILFEKKYRSKKCR